MSNNFLSVIKKDDFYYHPLLQIKFKNFKLKDDVLTLTNFEEFYLEIQKLSKTFFKIQIKLKSKVNAATLGYNLNEFLLLHRGCKTYFTDHNELSIVVAKRKKQIFEFSNTVVFSFYDTCMDCDPTITYLTIHEL